MKASIEINNFSDFKSASEHAKRLLIKYGESPSVIKVDNLYVVLATESLHKKMSGSISGKNKTKINSTNPAVPKSKVKATNVVIRNKSENNINIGNNISPSIGRMTKARFFKLKSEIAQAYNAAPAAIVNEWTKYTLMLLVSALYRRIKNVGNLGVLVLEKTGREVIDLGKAVVDKKSKTHISNRVSDASNYSNRKIKSLLSSFKLLYKSFKSNPGEVGPDILIASLAFSFASGGLDGDGGVPDSDITMFGIDAHRSIFTHSILAGVVIETGLYSIVDFISRAHRYLPKKHDQLWDTINNKTKEAADLSAKGVSVGLAYHFGVDAIFQPAAYHDLPFPAPIESHQLIMGVNAAAESIDISKKNASKINRMNDSARSELKKPRDVAGIAVAGLGALLIWMIS